MNPQGRQLIGIRMVSCMAGAADAFTSIPRRIRGKIVGRSRNAAGREANCRQSQQGYESEE